MVRRAVDEERLAWKVGSDVVEDGIDHVSIASELNVPMLVDVMSRVDDEDIDTGQMMVPGCLAALEDCLLVCRFFCVVFQPKEAVNRHVGESPVRYQCRSLEIDESFRFVQREGRVGTRRVILADRPAALVQVAGRITAEPILPHHYSGRPTHACADATTAALCALGRGLVRFFFFLSALASPSLVEASHLERVCPGGHHSAVAEQCAESSVPLPRDTIADEKDVLVSELVKEVFGVEVAQSTGQWSPYPTRHRRSAARVCGLPFRIKHIVESSPYRLAHVLANERRSPRNPIALCVRTGSFEIACLQFVDSILPQTSYLFGTRHCAHSGW